MGDEIWKVSVKGTIYEATLFELIEWIDEKRIDADTKVSRNGETWQRAGTVPELRELLPPPTLFGEKNKPPIISSTAPPVATPAPFASSMPGIVQPGILPTPIITFTCRNCRGIAPPIVKRQTTTAGWIVFAALLFFFFPLCWIGILMKEDIRRCAFCNSKMD